VQQSAQTQVSDLKQQQLRFWQGLRTLLNEKKSKVRSRKVRPQHWSDYSIGRAETWLTATINSQKKYLTVEFNFRGPAGKVWFDELSLSKAAIDAAVPGLTWQRLDNKKQSRIVLYSQNFDPTNENQWPQQYEWLAEKLERFREVFHPYAMAFSDTGEASGGADLEESEID
jgi:hypothetical protein